METIAATREATRRHRAALYAEKTPDGTRFTIWHGPKSKAKGRRVTVWTAEQLAEIIPENGAAIVYTSFQRGNPEGFGRRVFVRAEDGIAAILNDGNVSYGLPFGQDRTERVLVR